MVEFLTSAHKTTVRHPYEKALEVVFTLGDVRSFSGRQRQS